MALTAKERKVLARKYMAASQDPDSVRVGVSEGVSEDEGLRGTEEQEDGTFRRDFETVIGEDGMIYHDYGKGDIRAFKAKDNEDYRRRVGMAKNTQDYGVQQRIAGRQAAREGEGSTAMADFNNRASAAGAELDDNINMGPQGEVERTRNRTGAGGFAAAAPGEAEQVDGNGTGGASAPARLAQKRSKAQMRTDNPDMVERVKERWRKLGKIR